LAKHTLSSTSKSDDENDHEDENVKSSAKKKRDDRGDRGGRTKRQSKSKKQKRSRATPVDPSLVARFIDAECEQESDCSADESEREEQPSEADLRFVSSRDDLIPRRLKKNDDEKTLERDAEYRHREAEEHMRLLMEQRDEDFDNPRRPSRDYDDPDAEEQGEESRPLLPPVEKEHELVSVDIRSFFRRSTPVEPEQARFEDWILAEEQLELLRSTPWHKNEEIFMNFICDVNWFNELRQATELGVSHFMFPSPSPVHTADLLMSPFLRYAFANLPPMLRCSLRESRALRDWIKNHQYDTRIFGASILIKFADASTSKAS
jgi:hypothetical protein